VTQTHGSHGGGSCSVLLHHSQTFGDALRVGRIGMPGRAARAALCVDHRWRATRGVNIQPDVFLHWRPPSCELIASADAGGIWTIQTSVFPENEASVALSTSGSDLVGRRGRIAQIGGLWRDTILLERRGGTDP